MKKFHLIIIAVILLFSGCEDILEVNTTSSFNTDQGVITTEARAELALTGMYDGLQNQYYYGNYIITFGDLPSDNMDHTGTFVNSAEVDQNEIYVSKEKIIKKTNKLKIVLLNFIYFY